MESINILARLKESAKEDLVKLDEAEEVCIKLNKEKTKIMIQTKRKAPIIQNATLNDDRFDRNRMYHKHSSIYKTLIGRRQ